MEWGCARWAHPFIQAELEAEDGEAMEGEAT